MSNNEDNELTKAVVEPNNAEMRNGDNKSPQPPATPPPVEEDTQELIVVNENTDILDLNHGRIGKIENLEPLKNLERSVLL